MQEEQRRNLRHDILGCLNSIRLSTDVIRDSSDKTEIVRFLDCINLELTKVGAQIDKLVYDQPGNAMLAPAYHFIPLTDLPHDQH